MSDSLETPTRSSSIGALAAALGKAQAQIVAAAKDRENPFFHSRYATLGSCWDACRGPLTSNGLAVLQPVKADGARVTVTTLLAHSSGEWIQESLTLTALKNDPQSVGSAVTYGRRYGLAAMVGIAADDDDGQAASTHPEPAAPARKRPAPKNLDEAAIGLTEPQRKKLFALAKDAGLTSKEKLYELFPEGVVSTKQLTREQFDNLIETLTEMVPSA